MTKFRALQRAGGRSAAVTLPKRDLERDGLLDEEGEPIDGQQMAVDRLGEGTFLVRACDEGHVPEIHENPAIRRLAQSRAFDLVADGGIEAENSRSL